MPLISTEIVKYSLKHGVSQKSTFSFASYGMFKVFFESDYDGARALADVVRAITKKNTKKSVARDFDIRAHILLVRMF